jgi:hypothetical protein
MIISVVVFMVATTYHCSAQPSIRFRQGAAWIFGDRNRMRTQKRENRAMMVKTISRDELKKKIHPKNNFLLVET